MPRRARLRLAGLPLHLIQRGNNRGACFFAEDDRSIYLHHLGLLAVKFGCAVHAYVLMTNHVHLMLSPRAPEGASLLMKHLGQRYVQYVNRSHRRSGTLWEGRFRSSLVQNEGYLMRCYRYIEMNPVRARMVDHPAEYRWSSFRANAGGSPDGLITPHAEYMALGTDPAARSVAYSDLFKRDLELDELAEIRTAANAGFALGGERFRKDVEAMTGRRAGRGKPGRPAAAPAVDFRPQRVLP